jgi:hypothetical protein
MFFVSFESSLSSRFFWSSAALTAVSPATRGFWTSAFAISGVLLLGRITNAPTVPPSSAATSATGRILFVVVIGQCLLNLSNNF